MHTFGMALPWAKSLLRLPESKKASSTPQAACRACTNGPSPSPHPRLAWPPLLTQQSRQTQLRADLFPFCIPSSWMCFFPSVCIISYWNAIHFQHYIPDQVHDGATRFFPPNCVCVGGGRVKYTWHKLDNGNHVRVYSSVIKYIHVG